MDLDDEVDRIAAETAFSGVVRVDRGGEVVCARAYGMAHRGLAVPNTVDTRFGIASGTKALTALTVMSLVEEGVLELTTSARSVLGADLPLIDDAVTVEHLLAHRSGIGDYFDEDVVESMTDYVMPVPVHRLVTTEDYLSVLGDRPQKFVPGTQFSYCNGSYVVLALIAERLTCSSFHDLVRTRVCEPAGMHDTAFLRSDEPDGRTALGYLDADGPRTNLLHLPVVGSGDGGISTTAADVASMWRALHAGRILPLHRVTQVLTATSDLPDMGARYGLGFWLHATSSVVVLIGGDAGLSFRSVSDPESGLVHTVLSGTTEGARPVSRRLSELLGA